MNAVIKLLKSGKAPGEDDVRPEILRAMNTHGVRWLIRVCKVACRTGQWAITKEVANQCDNTCPQKRIQEKMHQF